VHAPDNFRASGSTVAKPSVDHIPLGSFVLTIKVGPDIMPTTDPGSSEDDDIFERRSKGRTVINRGALIFFVGNEAVHSCCVCDVTNDGAGIRLNGINIVPSDFGVSFDHFRTMRRCRMVWRDGDFLGAAFES
jgi:hypothetical protein